MITKLISVIFIILFHEYIIQFVFFSALLLVSLLVTNKKVAILLSWTLFTLYLLLPVFYERMIMSSFEAIVNNIMVVLLFILATIVTEREEEK